MSFLGEGADPTKEAIIGRQLHITHGEQLTSSDPQGLILGEGLANNLGAKTGDRVVLVTTNESGSINAVEARVRGIFYTSTKAFDDVALRTPIGEWHKASCVQQELTSGSYYLGTLTKQTSP